MSELTREQVETIVQLLQEKLPIEFWPGLVNLKTSHAALRTRVEEQTKKYKDLMKFYDEHVGTPCEQIRHAEQVDDLTRLAEEAEQQNTLYKSIFDRHRARERYISDATFQHIKHGDEAHQAWLKRALDEVLTLEGKPHETLDQLIQQVADLTAKLAAVEQERDNLDADYNELVLRPSSDYDQLKQQLAAVTQERDRLKSTLSDSQDELFKMSKRNLAAQAEAKALEQVVGDAISNLSCTVCQIEMKQALTPKVTP